MATTQTKTKKVLKSDEYHHGALREALISAAKEILKKDGWENLSLRKCAKNANVSPSAPAHHFKNLNELLTAVAASGFNDLANLFEKELEKVDDPNVDTLKLITLNYFRFARRNPDLYLVMFQSNLNKSEKEFFESHQRCFSLSKSEVIKMNSKLLNPNIEINTFRIYALTHGFTSLFLSQRLQMVFSKSAVPTTNEELEKMFLEYLFQ